MSEHGPNKHRDNFVVLWQSRKPDGKLGEWKVMQGHDGALKAAINEIKRLRECLSTA